MSFNLHNNHQLISREQHYFLSRKLISIHSEDRDISKWKNSNEFQISLPTSFENVQSIRLIQISFPNKLPVFSNNYNNTKLKFTRSANPSSYDIITIQEGSYSPQELVSELNSKFQSIFQSPRYVSVTYNSILNKFKFISNDPQFSLIFDEKYSEYDSNSNIFNQYKNWGLGSFIGFEKKIYTNTPITTDNGNEFMIESPNCLDVFGENAIYMEIDKCNAYDEILPYNNTNNSTYNNNRNTKVNSAFAKILINNKPNSDYEVNTLLGGKANYGFCSFEPPLENLSKFKFKFRYHDGRLVDFKNLSFNFTIEVNYLTNEILKYYTIRKPELL